MCQIHTSPESTQALHSSSLWHTQTGKIRKKKSTIKCNNKTKIETEMGGGGTSGNSSTELKEVVDPLCCSGRFRRCFTEPFLHTSMILSLEPGEKDRRRWFNFHHQLSRVPHVLTLLNLQHQSVPLQLEIDCRRSQERRKCLFTWMVWHTKNHNYKKKKKRICKFCLGTGK